MRDLEPGIDCSTTAAKVVAWDRAGKAVGEGRAPLQEIRPRRGYSEQRAEGWWDASATGTVIGWHHGHRRQHLFRAIEEGIAYEHRLAMKVSRRPPASASLST
jgi:sugar (pentulose or hexulose) kinase